MRIKTIAIALMLGLSLNANAGFYTNLELDERCQSGTEFQNGFCYGYVAAVFDALTNEGEICPKVGVKLGKVMRIIKKDLADEYREYTANSVVEVKLRSMFPCQKA